MQYINTLNSFILFVQALQDSIVEYDKTFDLIFPPQEWEEDGKTWRRTVSLTPATRKDLINFQKEFQSLLKYWQVREQGLCRARRELFTQCLGS